MQLGIHQDSPISLYWLSWHLNVVHVQIAQYNKQMSVYRYGEGELKGSCENKRWRH